MKRSIACFVLLLAVAAFCFSQTPTITPQTTGYVVKDGDTLYDLGITFQNDPQSWRRLIELNPFLKEPGRQFERDSKIIVLIHKGEVLNGLVELGLAPNPVPLDQLKVEMLPIASIPGSIPLSLGEKLLIALFVLVCALIIAGVVLYFLNQLRMKRKAAERERQAAAERQRQETERRRLDAEQAAARERELHRDPITAGPPMVQGGIPANQPERLENALSSQVAQAYADRHPGTDVNSVHPVRISPIEEGTLSGEGEVGYGDHPRHLVIDPPGRPGYQATFRMPDASEVVWQSLIQCMNPVYRGEGMRVFTFTPGRIIVPAPAPAATTPVAATAATDPAPVSPNQPTQQETAESRENRQFTFNYPTPSHPDYKVSFRNLVSFGVEEDAGTGEVTVRFRPRR